MQEESMTIFNIIMISFLSILIENCEQLLVRKAICHYLYFSEFFVNILLYLGK